MKPASFEYLAPASLEEAVELLARHGGEARVLAGGQSLVPLMNFRQLKPRVLVDINRLGDLDYVRREGDELRLGAMVRQSSVERSELVAEAAPLLQEATRYIGFRAVRNRGTLGGSLAHADPGAEYPVALLALDGSVVVRGPGGERQIAAGDLFRGPFRTSLETGELLTEIRVPVLGSRQAWSFQELDRRFPTHTVVNVAVVLDLDPEGRCDSARIALGGVAPTPVRRPEAEALLAGQPLGPETIREAAEVAARGLDPADEIHTPGAYKRDMARVFVARALARAVAPGGIEA